MASIASTVRDFKRDPEHYLPDDLVHDALSAAGHTWRDRLLGPVELYVLIPFAESA